MSEFLHIVCLDSPAPPDYGGAIDMYYKIASFAAMDKKIILHYFGYNDRSADDLKKYCYQVHKYKRLSSPSTFLSSTPYIISSRTNKDLIERLMMDDYPVILEGIHCTGIIQFLNKNRKVIVRIHNDEAAYYSVLARIEKNFLKRKYFEREARLLKDYQSGLKKDIPFACLSETDMEVFKQDYHYQDLHFIPCFIPWQEVNIKDGMGDYCLYHGNMGISENEEAAFWLIKNVFNQITSPFIIAGKNISFRLESLAKNYPHIRLINNPSIEALDDLIRNAQVNVLPSMNNTGVKLKLLHVMLEGRFCIANNKAIAGSRITKGLTIAESVSDWIKTINEQMDKRVTSSLIEERKDILSLYNNLRSAQRLNELL